MVRLFYSVLAPVHAQRTKVMTKRATLPEHGVYLARASTPQSQLWPLKFAVPSLPAKKRRKVQQRKMHDMRISYGLKRNNCGVNGDFFCTSGLVYTYLCFLCPVFITNETCLIFALALLTLWTQIYCNMPTRANKMRCVFFRRLNKTLQLAGVQYARVKTY